MPSPLNTDRTDRIVRHVPSQRALAARSWRRIEFMPSGEARREAIRDHFEQFRPARSCPVRRSS